MKKELVFGIHPVKSVLHKNPESIVELFVQKDRKDARIQDILKLAEQAGVRVQSVHQRALDEKTESNQHQGVAIICTAQPALQEDDLEKILDATQHPFILVLDGVQDPHNLGACVRTADAAGVTVVIAPKDNAVGLTPAARKVASGAAETVPFIQVTNLARTLRMLKERGIWLYGAAGEATDSLYNTKFPKSCALVMGAEGEGLRRLTRETCDYLIKIPMVGTVESLNVSVATGVCLFEMLRSRN